MQPNPLAGVLSQAAIRLLEERDVALEDYLAGITTSFVSESDSRLTDERSPTAHAPEHGAGGSDPVLISTANIQDGSVTAVKVAADVATQAELDAEAALARNADNLTSGTVADARIPATIARDSEVTSAITTHEAAADPHTGYQKESEKGAANGYAGLDSTTRVPSTNLATGTPDGTKFLRDDRTWAAPSTTPGPHAASHAVGGADHVSPDSINAEDLALTYMSGSGNPNPGSVQNIHLAPGAVGTSNLQDGSVTAAKVASDVATQAELDAEAALARNADNLTSGTVADARIPATIARDSEVTSAITTHEAAADPHTGYQKESEKNVQNGYAGLDNDADARVPAARLATGTPDGTKFLRDDRVWATAAFTADETLYWMQVNP